MAQTEQYKLNGNDNTPWQLELYSHSLKKQKKMQAILPLLPEVTGKQCLLITCGDNNGALNWHFKKLGGNWKWAEFEQERVEQIIELTGDEVVWIDQEKLQLPYENEMFDLILTIDVHEHLHQPGLLNKELLRLTRPNGVIVVTTPGADQTKLVNRIKLLAGIRPIDYGHLVPGYDVVDLENQLNEAGAKPYAAASYSRFFTELLEFFVNFGYVKILSRFRRKKLASGQVAPKSKDQLQSVNKSYRLYAVLFPIIRAVSSLDFLDRSKYGYAVIVAARKVL